MMTDTDPRSNLTNLPLIASDSIFVTEQGCIGINCRVIVMPAKQWHELSQPHMMETGRFKSALKAE